MDKQSILDCTIIFWEITMPNVGFWTNIFLVGFISKKLYLGANELYTFEIVCFQYHLLVYIHLSSLTLRVCCLGFMTGCRYALS